MLDANDLRRNVVGASISGGGNAFTRNRVVDSARFGASLVLASPRLEGNYVDGVGTTSGRYPRENWCIVLASASPEIVSTEITRATGGGSLIVEASLARDSSQGGLRVGSGTTLTVKGSSLTGNANHAVRNDDATVPANARNNWWGAAGGPPAGGANGALGNVLKSPWLAAPPAGVGPGS